MLFLQLSSRTVRFLPYFQVNKLACHNFTDVGGSCETPGSESKDCFTHGAASVMNISVFVSGPNLMGKIQMGPARYLHRQ